MIANLADKLPMRFQERDARILQSIQDYGGMLAKRQVQTIFWPIKSSRAMTKRLSKLKAYGYLTWPSLLQRKHFPIPEPIVWLDWKGAIFLANSTNLKIPEPTIINENQLRGLENTLRSKNFRWLREPHWTQLQHDLYGVDIRLKIEKDIQAFSHLRLSQWIQESSFRSDMDRVSFSYKDKNGIQRQQKRGVIPDGYFCLLDLQRHSQGLPSKAHFLLEVDMATHANPSFSIEKALAGAAYIHSQQYVDRFGSNTGRWLIVTTGEARMKHLMKQTEKITHKDSNLFLFTTFQDFFSRNSLQERIWSKCDKDSKVSLLEE